MPPRLDALTAERDAAARDLRLYERANAAEIEALAALDREIAQADAKWRVATRDISSEQRRVGRTLGFWRDDAFNLEPAFLGAVRSMIGISDPSDINALERKRDSNGNKVPAIEDAARAYAMRVINADSHVALLAGAAKNTYDHWVKLQKERTRRGTEWMLLKRRLATCEISVNNEINATTNRRERRALKSGDTTPTKAAALEAAKVVLLEIHDGLRQVPGYPAADPKSDTHRSIGV